VIGTYLAVVAVCGATLAVGQAAIALCGVRSWSWLSPAVGLALLCAICWATVRLPKNGVVSAVAIPLVTVASVAFLRGRTTGFRQAVAIGAPVGLIALAAASLPFVAEGHSGILGTGFNPDMSQHLLAADRLAHGTGSELLSQGYPLGPHAVVVALNKGLGIGLVQGFSGLTIAVAFLAPLTALTVFGNEAPLRRTIGSLLVGLPYLVASYFAQGAFKEIMQALFVLAFALALRESGRPVWAGQPLRFLPAALIAVGTVYTYSFPGLIWLGGILLTWLVLVGWVTRASFPTRPALLAFTLFMVGALPELGRMIDFRSFETFNPAGPGLGNLFGQISPFEALGVWPSGDFRLAPGDGAAPAFVYYLGAALAATLLVYGLVLCWRRRETALIAGVIVGTGVYGLARIDGTPYTAAKAIEIAAPLATLVILAPLARVGTPLAREGAPIAREGGWRFSRIAGLVAVLYVVAAAGCSLLAFANAPIGPSSYSPALTELRPLIRSGSTLVLAPDRLLNEEHGARYISWELRGGRVCIESETAAGGPLPGGIRFVVTSGASGTRPFPGFRLRQRRPPYALWERRGSPPGPGQCPLIAVRQARHGPQQ
jgi:hypothetical protein